MVRVILSTLLLTIFVQARPQYFYLLSAQIPKNNVPHKCMTCHNGRAMNLFGADYYSFFVKPDVFTNGLAERQKWDLLLNKKDSNKNGVSNLQDIVDGKNPGIKQP